MRRVKRMVVAALASAMVLSVMAAPALAFHHGSIPASQCANEKAGSPSNENGMAKEHLAPQERGGEAAFPLPLPPVGTPGAGQGGENCAGSGD